MKKHVTIALAILLIVFTLIAAIFTYHSLAQQHARTHAKPLTHTTSRTPQNTAPSLKQVQHIKSIVIVYERHMREWGYNPADISNTLTGATISTLNNLEHIPLDPKYNNYNLKGAAMMSRWCTRQATCFLGSTNWDYQTYLHPLMGARIVDYHIQVHSATKATITGTLKLLISDNLAAFDNQSAWAFTPGVATTKFKSRLTLSNNTVISRRTLTPETWLSDPYFQDWDANPISYYKWTRYSIPITGPQYAWHDLGEVWEQHLPEYRDGTGSQWAAYPPLESN